MASPIGSSPTVGVVIVESIGIVRASLRMLFAAEPDFEVLGEAQEAEPALEVVSGLPTHSNVVVLAGLDFPGERDLFWLIRAIRDQSPTLVILATGSDLTRAAISQSLFFGADGFIHKNSPPDRFIEATRRAAAGELVLEGLPRGSLGQIVEGIDDQRAGQRAGQPVLTDREVDVLTAAADGLTARGIGRRLGVSERTVTTHLHHIYRKLGASGRVAAISAATRLGVLSPEVQRADTLVAN